MLSGSLMPSVFISPSGVLSPQGVKCGPQALPEQASLSPSQMQGDPSPPSLTAPIPLPTALPIADSCNEEGCEKERAEKPAQQHVPLKADDSAHSCAEKTGCQELTGCHEASYAEEKEVEDPMSHLLSDGAGVAADLRAGGAKCERALKRLEGLVWQLSDHKDGCHLIQLALERAQGAARGKLVKELHSHVREAMSSPYANFVLQRVVEVMPLQIASFIVKELSGIAAYASRHKYGCRIVCRLVQQFPSAHCVVDLLRVALANTDELINHTFGNYVAAAIMEHGRDEQKHCIAVQLMRDPLGHATSKFGSRIVESALKHCRGDDVANLAEQLLASRSLDQLVWDQYGIYVVRSLSELPGQPSEIVFKLLSSTPPEMQQDKNFQKLLTLVLSMATKTRSRQ